MPYVIRKIDGKPTNLSSVLLVEEEIERLRGDGHVYEVQNTTTRRVIKIGDKTKAEPRVYASTFCNMGHNLKTGRPVAHECRIIPPRALQAERDGDFDKAIRILQNSPARYVRGR